MESPESGYPAGTENWKWQITKDDTRKYELKKQTTGKMDRLSNGKKVQCGKNNWKEMVYQSEQTEKNKS